MSVSNVSSSSTGVTPTNTGTISFSNVGGFNYSSIIQELTSISEQQETPYQNKITTVNAQNTELTTIQNLLASLQSSLKAISDPTTFSSYSATPSDTTQITTTADPATTPVGGTYTVDKTVLGTASSITGLSTIGQPVSANVNGTASNNVPLVDSYVSVTPQNGSTGTSTVTIDGVTISYDVTSQSLSTIIANINTAVQAVDPGFSATYNAGGDDKVSFTSSDHSISLGSPNDTGNLLDVLKLSSAEINNTPTSGSVSSVSGIGGVNQYLTLNGTNPAGQTVNANFQTAVTAGSFSINGVSFTVDPSTDALSDIIKDINASTAGVTASFDPTSGSLTLSSNTVGAQSIVLGTSSETSNFLVATGLAGGTATLGTQSSVTVTNTAGIQNTVYANSATIANAIPGFDVTVLKSEDNTAAGNSLNPVTVGTDTKTAETAITSFTTAYNAVIEELNNATAAPVVTQSNGTSSSEGGGVFFGNSVITDLKNQLVNLVSSVQSGSNNYNSLASIGLQLDSTFSVITSGTSSGTSVSGATNTAVSGAGNSGINVETLQGTDGAFQPLDTTTFESAFASDPQAVTNIFTNSSNFVNQLGDLLTNETGLSTVLANGLAGTAPAQSVLAGLSSENDAVIAEAQQQITNIQAQIQSQSNSLQTEYQAASATISSLQQQQSYLSAISGSSTSSSSSSLGG